jgi:hypothetical protein
MPMKDVPENELLSAFLDGELTAAEQAEVEQLLARSPAARQLLEEFRALAATLQSLPQSKLGEDLSQPVLQIAQRRMLSGSPAPAELARPAVRPAAAILRRVFNPRALVWSALAVGVAVMLTVVNWRPADRPAGNGIAKAPAPERKGGRAPEIGPAPVAGQRHEESRFGEPEAPPVEKPGKEVRGTMVAGAPPAAAPAEVRGLSHQFEAQQPPPEDLAVEKAAPGRQPPGGPSEGPAPTRSRYAGQREAGNEAARVIAANGNAPQIGKGGDRPFGGTPKTPRPGEGMPQIAGSAKGLGSFGSGGAQLLDSGQASLRAVLAEPATGYAVVCCDVSPKAFQGRVIDDVLAVNGIALSGTVTEMDALKASQTGQTDAKAPPADRPTQQKAEQQVQDLAGVRLAALPQAGQLDLVCVEGTREQLEAALDVLKSDRVEFLSVSVKPAPGVEAQKDWARRFGRPLGQEAKAAAEGTVREAYDSAKEVAKAAVLAEQRREAAAEGKLARTGRAWRLQIAAPAMYGMPYEPMGGFGGGRAGTMVQQPAPAVPSPPPVAAQPPAELPAKESLAGEPRKPDVPALSPEASPSPGQQPGKSQGPGDRPAKSPSYRRDVTNAPPRDGHPPTPPIAGQDEQAKKPPTASVGAPGTPGPQERVKAPGQVGLTQEGMGQSTSPEKSGAAEEGRELQAPGTAGRPSALVPPQAGELGRGRLQAHIRREAEAQQPLERKTELQEGRRQLAGLGAPQPPAPAYRVLLVLRRVGPDVSRPPAAAASAIEPTQPPAAKPDAGPEQ